MAVTTRRVVREIPRAAILHIDAKEVLRMVVVAYARVSTEKEEQERPLWVLQKLEKFKKCVSQMH